MNLNKYKKKTHKKPIAFTLDSEVVVALNKLNLNKSAFVNDLLKEFLLKKEAKNDKTG